MPKYELKIKICHTCQKPLTKPKIKEQQYLGSHGQTLKEVIIDGAESEEVREPINIIYYCSINCMERQMDKEEEELWKKGPCQNCGVSLAVINEHCQDLEHKKEACLLPVETPNCLKN